MGYYELTNISCITCSDIFITAQNYSLISLRLAKDQNGKTYHHKLFFKVRINPTIKQAAMDWQWHFDLYVWLIGMSEIQFYFSVMFYFHKNLNLDINSESSEIVLVLISSWYPKCNENMLVKIWNFSWSKGDNSGTTFLMMKMYHEKKLFPAVESRDRCKVK